MKDDKLKSYLKERLGDYTHPVDETLWLSIVRDTAPRRRRKISPMVISWVSAAMIAFAVLLFTWQRDKEIELAEPLSSVTQLPEVYDVSTLDRQDEPSALPDISKLIARKTNPIISDTVAQISTEPKVVTDVPADSSSVSRQEEPTKKEVVPPRNTKPVRIIVGKQVKRNKNALLSLKVNGRGFSGNDLMSGGMAGIPQGSDGYRQGLAYGKLRYFGSDSQSGGSGNLQNPGGDGRGGGPTESHKPGDFTNNPKNPPGHDGANIGSGKAQDHGGDEGEPQDPGDGEDKPQEPGSNRRLGYGNSAVLDELVQSDDFVYDIPLSFVLSFRKNLSSRFSVETGLSYTRLHTRFIIPVGDAGVKLHYLGIPLKVNYTFIDGRRMSLYAGAGGMVEKQVDGEFYTPEGDKMLDNSVWQWSINASVGLSVKLGGTVGLFAEPGISYFFDNDSNIPTIRSDQPLNFNFQAGLRFTFD